ncbi:bacteriophage spanin2 family protein [Kaistella palustris]|uniref:bacteriophage spanin2 family protein n=1 Tax=Kaistella palustris TaxID=493376 RepID=UPI000418099C|nr:bacteriophage spanin2 family protein [Kaistella palustris]
MKRSFSLFILFLLFTATACQTRVVSAQKPLQPNSLELYERYTIQTNDAKEFKVQVLKQDAGKIYAKSKSGEDVVINKSDVREVKKLNVLASVVIGLAAVAAVIFVPI